MLLLTINVTLFYAAPLLYIIFNNNLLIYYIYYRKIISRHMYISFVVKKPQKVKNKMYVVLMKKCFSLFVCFSLFYCVGVLQT